MMNPELVIFDLDGVLVDSELLSAQALSEVLDEHGVTVGADEVVERYTGLSDNEIAAQVSRESGRALPGNFAELAQERALALFDGAAKDIQTFVEKNPTNRNADQARLDVGTIRLAFVQWAREVLEDPEELKEWGITANQLSEDAQSAVDKAIDYFKALRPKPSDMNPKTYEELASYYYVISQYYRALVEAPCSPAAARATPS